MPHHLLIDVRNLQVRHSRLSSAPASESCPILLTKVKVFEAGHFHNPYLYDARGKGTNDLALFGATAC